MKKLICLAAILLSLGLITIYYLLWIWNPLPSDEEMIDDFKEHRNEFIEVVHRYRSYPHTEKNRTCGCSIKNDFITRRMDKAYTWIECPTQRLLMFRQRIPTRLGIDRI